MDIEHPADLRAYLVSTGRLAPDEQVTMRVLAGGVSNRTVLLKRQQGQDWVLKQALEKLRVKADWFSDPERIHCEAEGMRYLYRIAPEHITRLIFEDQQEHILVMEAVAEPHQNWKTMLLGGNLELAHVQQFATLLATIHRESFRMNSHGEIQKAFAERRYFESLRLEPYYLYSAERVAAASSFLRELVAATRKRLITLVHGDYSPKNILLHEDKLILLDHEVIHFGDPAFDCGFALTHLLSKAHQLPAQREALREAALVFWQVYANAVQDVPWFEELESFAMQHSLACLLARVAGRSPLEYLDEAAQVRQQAVVLSLIEQAPRSMEQLIVAFVKGVEHVGDQST